MNVQSHMSGQISGQVPNQAGNQLPGLPQQNGNTFHMQMQNVAAQSNSSVEGSEVIKIRRFMRDKIYETLVKRQSQQTEIISKKIQDISRRLEEGLFKSAMSMLKNISGVPNLVEVQYRAQTWSPWFPEAMQFLEVTKARALAYLKRRHEEDYMNLNTLESRLHFLVKRTPHSNHAAQHSQFVNTSTPVGAMIPTPGIQHNGNPNLTTSSAGDASMISANACGSISSATTNMGNLMPNVTGSFSNMSGGSFHVAEGSLANSYQQIPSSFSMSSTGNNMMAGQRVTSQMIPTPGFTGNSSQMVSNLDNSNSSGVFSGVDLSMVPQQLPQKHAGGQNSRVLQSLSGAMSSGVRSFMQQRFQNGSLNNGLGNNLHMLNGSGSSDSYLSPSSFGVSSKPLQQPLDQHQRSATQGEGYRSGASGSSGTGSFYNPTAANSSLVNTQNLNQLRSQSITRPNSIMSSQSNIQTAQSASYMRPLVVDQAEKVNLQSQSRENLSQNSVNQYQQQSHRLQQQQQFASYCQERQSNLQQQALMRTDARISHVKPEPGMENRSEQVSSGQLHLSELDGQFQHTANGSRFRNSQSSSLPFEPQDMCSTLLQNPQQVMSDEAANEYTSLSNGMQPEVLSDGQWHSEQQRASLAGNLSHEHHVQEKFHHRAVVNDGAQRSIFLSELPVNHQTVASGNTVEIHHRVVVHDGAERNAFSSEAPVIHQTVASGDTVDPPTLVATSCSSGNANRDRQFKNQKRWLLFLRHARWCRAPEGKCPESNCFIAQKLLKHMDGCNASPCSFPRCYPSRRLLHHYRNCRDPNCPVCVPVKDFIRSQVKTYAHQDSDPGLPSAVSGTFKSSELEAAKAKETPGPSEIAVEVGEHLQPSMKRFKSEPSSQSLMPEGINKSAPAHANSSNFGSANVPLEELEKNDHNLQIKSEVPAVKTEIPSGSNPSATEIKSMTTETSCNQGEDGESVLKDFNSSAKEESVEVEKDNDQMKEEGVPPATELGAGTKTGKPKIKGVSLTELFTPEQIREHIRSLRKWVGQSKSKVEKIQALEHSMSENSCQLCAVEKLTFEPPPIYCSPCGARIKRNAMYYTVGAGDTRHYFCIPCYNEARGDTISVDGTAISKTRLEKKKNDEETEEWWVQCDKCEAWQHQICALFNGRRNDGGQAEYTCPNCCIQEIERGERQPLPQSAVLGAKDLPRTVLSDHIEQRLFRKLKQERQDRARSQGKSYDEVPGAEGIVVRVVSSVDKKLEVKPRFLEIFREENYPTEFPYKSKVVLLFQKIEGVEVCLFGMYVQEFGSECQPPNQRRVYLSYLDSVKYFRPEVKAVTGEALRTFVYHEILIGYLEYCKIRGFTSCYIWACPPLKGEDYILYCHPEIQKTPKSDKLREWYLSMLRKAARESIVVELTNLYDHFFIQTGECKAKVTAARLPYFDGDYWPGAAEDMIYQIYQEEEGRKQNKKGTTKKAITKRALKATGQSDLSSNASKDILLMHKLGETILPMKEDFIMVHLQYSCTHCCMLMVYGNRWVCKQCKNFQLCDKCYGAEQKREDRERHPISQKDKHALFPVEITDVPDDTKDKDEILESEFFDTRQAFLSLCQGNHYQYDTLRRAKHSSMMVLYHLHNPTAPAFVTTCNVCHLDIETGQGWRCETCPDYDVCNNCYLKDGGIDHPHKLTNHPSLADRDAQNKEARQLRVLQLRKMLDLLVHASQCRSAHCQYPNCRKVKGLFRHGIQCRTRASGGCVLCKKMWYLLQLHARACKESECHVPRCRDLKEHLRRLQQQSDSRRRAAVMEMMRQRAAEVSGSAS